MWHDLAARAGPGHPELVHAGLVHRLAEKFLRRNHDCGLDLDDLMVVGCVALKDAVAGYDPARGTKLAAYVAKVVDNAFLREALAFNQFHVRVDLGLAAYRVMAGEDPPDWFVARAAAEPSIRRLLKKTLRALKARRVGAIPRRRADDGPAGDVRRIDDTEELDWLLARLPPAWADLVRRVAIAGESFGDVARSRGRTPQAVRATYYRALARLRAFLEADHAADDPGPAVGGPGRP